MTLSGQSVSIQERGPYLACAGGSPWRESLVNCLAVKKCRDQELQQNAQPPRI
jgi:hypothetical protein